MRNHENMKYFYQLPEDPNCMSFKLWCEYGWICATETIMTKMT
jgi:hypothetical protein